MWKRNLLFLGLIAGGIVTLGANLIPPRERTQISSYDDTAHRGAEFQESIDRVNASFRQKWAEEDFRKAPAAPDLAIARRLALGLMGTIPSVEELRQLERLPPEQRL